MERVARGDRAACRTVMDYHLKPVLGLAFRLLGDGAEAEDVAQEAFIRLWQQAPRWRPEARVGTWLFQVARNLCIDRLRRRRESIPATLPEVPDSRDTPERAYQRSQVAARVHQAVGALPERQRTAIHLVHFQGMDNREAARMLNVGVRALESLLARGRRTLKDRLGKWSG